MQRTRETFRRSSLEGAIAFADPTAVILRAEASTGEVREDVDETAAEPRGVTLSPEGRPWFAEPGTNGHPIGRT